MALRKKGVTFLTCFRKKEITRKGGLPQKRGVSSSGRNYAISGGSVNNNVININKLWEVSTSFVILYYLWLQHYFFFNHEKYNLAKIWRGCSVNSSKMTAKFDSPYNFWLRNHFDFPLQFDIYKKWIFQDFTEILLDNGMHNYKK